MYVDEVSFRMRGVDSGELAVGFRALVRIVTAASVTHEMHDELIRGELQRIDAIRAGVGMLIPEAANLRKRAEVNH